MITWKYIENTNTWVGTKFLFKTNFENYYFQYNIYPCSPKIISKGKFFIRCSLRTSSGGIIASSRIYKNNIIDFVEKAKGLSEKHLGSIADSLTSIDPA